MLEIKIKHVVSFSSEDKVHKAENLLNPETYRKWKCAYPGEKNATIVLQFEKATQIHSIDIGNECSAFIEVFVGRSSDSVSNYQILLAESSFMNPLESRNGTHTNRIRMFGPDKLQPQVKDKKWDCVQVVCTQPFNKYITYGLTFIKFHSPSETIEEQPNNTEEEKGLCMGGLDSSAYLSNAMGSPAVMVLSSTCGADVTPHSQSHVSFASRQGRTDNGKDSGGLTTGTGPFPNPSFPVRPLFGQTDPYTLSSPLLSLHHPLLASHAFRNSYFNPGAFRPLSLSDDRNGAFHGSAFVPAKCVKMDGSQGPGSDSISGSQSLLLGPCYQSGESGFHQSPANSTGSSMGHGTGGNSGYLDGKEDRTDSDSIVDGADRMSETPNLSEESRSIERSTPEERGTPKRHKKYFLDGQTPYCPICGTPVQSSELLAHYEFEVDKLLEMSKCISQQLEASSIHSPFSSPMCMVRKDDKSKPESRWETYQRVKGNRTTRLTSARCLIKRKKWDDDRIQDDHLLPPALRKRESLDVDSAEASSIDSRADFNWAVTARLHAFASLQRALPAPDYGGRKFEVTEDDNQELNVDGDDSATYGQPHYTEADIITCSTEDNAENKDQIRRIQSNDSNYQRHSDSSQWAVNGGNNNNGEGQEVTSTCVNNNDASECASPSEKTSKQGKEANSDNNKDHIEDGIKCLICMEPFIKPVVSICCWHVHCEECWLKTLGTKKLCPQCNMITSPRDLRRIFL